MKLFEKYEDWAELPAGSAWPRVTLRSGVSGRLAPMPYWRERVKLHARAFVHRACTRPWLTLLNSHPAFADYVRNCPRLVQKIYRPYLTTNLDMDARLAVLGSHYAFVLRHGLGQIVEQASRCGVMLGSVEGKTGSRYQVWLRAIEPMDREGELVLQLFEASTLVYSIAFTFSDLEGFGVVSVGCIQGPNHGNGLEAIRKATRELHGKRPKQLMVNLVSQLGYELGCRQMRLVGNPNRVVLGALRQGRVRADYDELWKELGAGKRADADFELPCAPIRLPDLERICSRKRSAARKRHHVALELANEITRNFCGRPQFLQTMGGTIHPVAIP